MTGQVKILVHSERGGLAFMELTCSHLSAQT
jgi:hypothetical protein